MTSVVFSPVAMAQSPAKVVFQKGKVVANEVLVYQDPDFDSPVIGRFKTGSIVNISQEVFGAFFQVQISRGRVAYVSDVDVRPLIDGKRVKKLVPVDQRDPLEGLTAEKREALLLKRPYDSTDFKGLQVANVRFRENTMGLRPTDNRTFVGFTASGPHIIVDGLYTNFNFLFSPGAPRYYEQATGHGADGFILITNFLMQTVTSRGRDVMTYVGFGPMYRYSRFGVTFDNVNTGKQESYSLEDMALGAVFNLGVGARFGRLSIKAEAQYYWEKLQYTGYAALGQISF